MSAYIFAVEKNPKPQLLRVLILPKNQQREYITLHYSFSSPTEENKNPMTNNIADTNPETRATSGLNYPFTKGCKNAKIIKAMPRLIAPLPGSLIPLENFITTILTVSINVAIPLINRDSATRNR